MALRENYRELLQDAAVLVVARDGLEHATTKSIAGEVACNEGLLQAAFNRADIAFVQNVLKHIDVMDEADRSLEERCHALWDPVWAFCVGKPDIVQFYLRYYYSAQYLTSAHELHHRNYQQLQARLSRYFRSSRDSWFLMAHVFETILSFCSHILSGELENTPAVSDEIFQLIFHTLQPYMLS